MPQAISKSWFLLKKRIDSFKGTFYHFFFFGFHYGEDMSQLRTLFPLFFILISFFQGHLDAKNRGDKKIDKMYGGYDFRAGYELFQPGKKPLKVRLRIYRDTLITRCVDSYIGRAKFCCIAKFSLKNTSQELWSSSQNGLQRQLLEIAKKTPDEWMEPLTDFCTRAYAKYADCDSQFMPQSITTFVQIKSPGCDYRVIPKKGAYLISHFAFREYSRKRKKIARTFTGSVIVTNTVSSEGKKRTIAKVVKGLARSKKHAKSLITIIQVDGIIKTIKARKMQPSSFWYPHIVRRVKKILLHEADFLQAHEDMTKLNQIMR